MKRVLVLALAMMMILLGCGNESEAKENVNNDKDKVVQENEPNSMQENETDSMQENESDFMQENESDFMQEIYRLEILGKWGDDVISENKETDEWCYSVYKKGDLGCVHVYQYKGTDKDIVIPDSFDGYPVTAVVDPRMYTVLESDPNLKSFTRSYDKSEITSIQFPDTIYKTYDDIFDDTVWYENQPDGEVYIGNILYKYKGEMSSGTVIDVREGTLSICEGAFSKCANLKKIIIPDSVLWLDERVFSDCASLNEVQLSSNIITLGDKLFMNTPNLKELYIPKSYCRSGINLFKKSSIEKVYYEGSSDQWKNMWGRISESHTFELETETPFPY